MGENKMGRGGERGRKGDREREREGSLEDQKEGERKGERDFSSLNNSEEWASSTCQEVEALPVVERGCVQEAASWRITFLNKRDNQSSFLLPSLQVLQCFQRAELCQMT